MLTRQDSRQGATVYQIEREEAAHRLDRLAPLHRHDPAVAKRADELCAVHQALESRTSGCQCRLDDAACAEGSQWGVLANLICGRKPAERHS